MDAEQLGSWAFIVGVLIAIIAGLGAASVLGPLAEWVPLLLIVLGLVVGLLNITDKEVDKFLIAAVALIAVGTTAGGITIIPYVGEAFASIVQYIAVFVAPAAVLVAIKSVHSLASSA